LWLSLVFDVQKGKFLAAEKFALLPAFLKFCPQEAGQSAVLVVFSLFQALRPSLFFSKKFCF
jgi:hypothetical protein